MHLPQIPDLQEATSQNQNPQRCPFLREEQACVRRSMPPSPLGYMQMVYYHGCIPPQNNRVHPPMNAHTHTYIIAWCRLRYENFAEGELARKAAEGETESEEDEESSDENEVCICV